MQKHNQYTRNCNEVKRIILPCGYSNDLDADCVRTRGAGLEENGNLKTQVQRANLGHAARMGHPPETFAIFSVFTRHVKVE